MVGQKKTWMMVGLLIMAGLQIGCQSKKVDTRLTSIGDCAGTLSTAFGVPSEWLSMSPLQGQVSGIQAQSSSFGGFWIGVQTYYGALSYNFYNGPQANYVSQGVTDAQQMYAVQYACLEPTCFRIGVLISQNTGDPMSGAMIGSVLQQTSSGSNSWTSVCMSTDIPNLNSSN